MQSSDLLIALRGLPKSKILQALEDLSDADVEAILYHWPTWARDKQLAPEGNWRTWLVLAGRGFGKTRTGAEWVRDQVEQGKAGRLALIGPTAADARDVMVEGESGLLAIAPPWNRPHYEPSKRRLTWPNGAIATTYSADEPERLRGPQHDAGWADEPASWRYPDAWDMLMFGLRLGDDPRMVVTGTPKPVKLIKQLAKDPTTVITSGSTYENRANLAGAFLDQIVRRYEGSRLGRQELHAEILDDNPNALWKRDQIDALRVTHHPDLVRVVVGVDPAATSEAESAETGIVAAGLGTDGDLYILDDMSLRESPNGWGRAAVTAYHKHRGDLVVAEVNNGGDMVIYVIETVDASVPTKKVHASRGKLTRAEPIAALYEQGRAHHVGHFPQLEDQMCEWQPGMPSPDRLDAMVWAATDLMLGEEPADGVLEYYDPVNISPY